MSTSCHILFTDGDTQLLTYKHNDGHPEGVIPLVREFWEWYPRPDQFDYLTASWFYYCKRKKEERFNRGRYNPPMETAELDCNHPVALSFGICPDDPNYVDIEHFYEVDTSEATVAHYTPYELYFDTTDSPDDIISREPDETYTLGSGSTENQSSNQISCQVTGISDGGQVKNNDSDEGCASCGSTEGTNWVVQAGTPAGNYLNLADGKTTELCDRCMREVADSVGDGDESFQDESTKGGENER
jgi:hypothetical protein